MVSKLRKKPHSPEFKMRVALEALKGNKTVQELCQEFGVVSSQIYKWKNALLERGKDVFNGTIPSDESIKREFDKLHSTIGRLKVENDFLSSVLGKYS